MTNRIRRQTASAYAVILFLAGGHEADAEELSHPNEKSHGHGD